MADEKFNLLAFSTAFGVSVLSSAVPAWLARGGKEGRTVIGSAAATGILLGGVYGVPAVLASYWPSIAAITIGLGGWIWILARQRHLTSSLRKADTSTASTPNPGSAGARDPLVISHSATPTIYVQEDREPAIAGLILTVVNISDRALLIRSATLSLTGDNVGIVTDRLLTLGATSLPFSSASLSLSDIGLSDEVAKRFRKNATSDCVSLSMRVELEIQDAEIIRRLQMATTTWSRIVRTARATTEPQASINIHGSHIGGDLVGRDKKR